MTLTHLENGGWSIADLRRLSVHDIGEDAGAALHAALSSTDPGQATGSGSEVLDAAVASGVLVEYTAQTPAVSIWPVAALGAEDRRGCTAHAPPATSRKGPQP